MENGNILEKYKYLKKLNLEGYLWEFIRRNEDYKKLYNEFIKCKEHKKLNWYELSKDNKFKMKFNYYGLKYPLDPSKQANEIKDLESYFMINQPLEFICLDDHPDRALYFKDIKATGHKGVMLIDLRASNKNIISNFEKTIKKVKKHFSNLNKPTPKVNIRSRIENWYDYLIEYDLKVINEKKPREIADILKHKEHEIYLQEHTSECPVCKKVRRHIRETKQLINKINYRKFIPSLKMSK